MKRALIVLFFLVSATGLAGDQATAPQTAKPSAKYGANAVVGRTFVHDGIKLT